MLVVRDAQAAEGRKAMNEQEPELAAASAEDGLRVVTSRDDVTVGVTALKHLKAKQRRASNTGRPAFERDARDEIDRDSGRMTWREQVFDRANDYWSETVIFQDTGEHKFPPKSGRLSEKPRRSVNRRVRDETRKQVCGDLAS